jgi:hypothetical protein
VDTLGADQAPASAQATIGCPECNGDPHFPLCRSCGGTGHLTDDGLALYLDRREDLLNEECARADRAEATLRSLATPDPAAGEVARWRQWASEVLAKVRERLRREGDQARRDGRVPDTEDLLARYNGAQECLAAILLAAPAWPTVPRIGEIRATLEDVGQLGWMEECGCCYTAAGRKLTDHAREWLAWLADEHDRLAAEAGAARSPAPAAPRHGLYVASKARHAPRWLELRASGVPIISTWIDEAGPGQTASWSDLWLRVVREVSSSSALVFHHEPGDTEKGALVEVGSALASGTPVFAVGAEEFNFNAHPLVTLCASLDEAVQTARAYDRAHADPAARE